MEITTKFNVLWNQLFHKQINASDKPKKEELDKGKEAETVEGENRPIIININNPTDKVQPIVLFDLLKKINDEVECDTGSFNKYDYIFKLCQINPFKVKKIVLFCEKTEQYENLITFINEDIYVEAKVGILPLNYISMFKEKKYIEIKDINYTINGKHNINFDLNAHTDISLHFYPLLKNETKEIKPRGVFGVIVENKSNTSKTIKLFNLEHEQGEITIKNIFGSAFATYQEMMLSLSNKPLPNNFSLKIYSRKYTDLYHSIITHHPDRTPDIKPTKIIFQHKHPFQGIFNLMQLPNKFKIDIFNSIKVQMPANSEMYFIFNELFEGEIPLEREYLSLKKKYIKKLELINNYIKINN